MKKVTTILTNTGPVAADVGLRAVGLLVDERVAPQKLVQRGLATVESIDLIRCSELANG